MPDSPQSPIREPKSVLTRLRNRVALTAVTVVAGVGSLAAPAVADTTPPSAGKIGGAEQQWRNAKALQRHGGDFGVGLTVTVDQTTLSDGRSLNKITWLAEINNQSLKLDTSSRPLHLSRIEVKVDGKPKWTIEIPRHAKGQSMNMAHATFAKFEKSHTTTDQGKWTAVAYVSEGSGANSVDVKAVPVKLQVFNPQQEVAPAPEPIAPPSVTMTPASPTDMGL